MEPSVPMIMFLFNLYALVNSYRPCYLVFSRLAFIRASKAGNLNFSVKMKIQELLECNIGG